MKKILNLTLIMLLAAGIFVGCGSANFETTGEMTVVSREDGSGTRGAFIELFGIEVKEADGSKKDYTTKDSIITNKTDVMLTNVENDPYAIGYISLGSLNNSVKAIQIDGVTASAENIKNGSYTISRPFNIATRGEPSDLAKDFINFIMSAEGQELVAANYIAVNENAEPYDGNKPGGKLVIAGSSSVTPIMEKLTEAYAGINPNADLQIQMSDSTTGMNNAIEGICDIGMASRELKDSEAEKLIGLTIALDGIAVIVNNQNPTENLEAETVRQIFTGEITTWEL